MTTISAAVGLPLKGYPALTHLCRQAPFLRTKRAAINLTPFLRTAPLDGVSDFCKRQTTPDFAIERGCRIRIVHRAGQSACGIETVQVHRQFLEATGDAD